MATPSQTAVDTVRQQAQTAARSTRVTVTKPGVPGVYLRLKPAADPRTEPAAEPAAEPAPDGDSRDQPQALLRAFSPQFVAFRDATAGSPRPSSKGAEDYHPRPVEAYLDKVTPYVASPRGWLSGLYVATTTALMASIAALWLRRLAGIPLSETEFRVVLLVAAAMCLIALLLIAQAPVSIARLRERATTGQTERLGVRRAWFEPPKESWWADRAWAQYEREVAATARYPRRIYGRAVQVGEERYLQYWQFYVFNDWYNRHEADWELVVVRVGRAGDGWAPIGAAYSSHFGGHWRPSGEVQWRDGTHPVVYVARGSHAQYFESKDGGYTASLSQSFGSLQIQIGRKDWNDELADDPEPDATPEDYELWVMPEVSDDAAWTDDDRRQWWWLRYRGLWGGSGAIAGPVDQGAKWSDPARWVADAVQRDSPAWDTLALGEPVDVR